MAKFTRFNKPLEILRQQYLQTLEGDQEFFVEELVGLGQFWAHEDGSYGIANGSTLVEFFSPDPKNATKRLRYLHAQDCFSTALVKSYDCGFKQACEALGFTSAVGGYLFRKRVPRAHIGFPNAEISAATQTDVPSIWNINDDFFEGQYEIAKLARMGKLWVLRVNGEVAGCGVSNRFIDSSNAVDVGMMVARDYRRRGLGTYIVSEIASKIESDGLRPICGCGSNNLASKSTLEKAGFISEHQLLSFTKR